MIVVVVAFNAGIAVLLDELFQNRSAAVRFLGKDGGGCMLTLVAPHLVCVSEHG